MSSGIIHIKVDSNEVKQALKIAPRSVIRGINTSLKRSAVYTQRTFKIKMPVGATGLLRRSVKYHFDSKTSVMIEPTAKHADYVEKGTKPHWVGIDKIERWAKQRGINPYALQRGIAKRGTKAHPFLHSVKVEAERFAGDDMTKTLQDVIDNTI